MTRMTVLWFKKIPLFDNAGEVSGGRSDAYFHIYNYQNPLSISILEDAVY